jgi:hypothetical protein
MEGIGCFGSPDIYLVYRQMPEADPFNLRGRIFGGRLISAEEFEAVMGPLRQQRLYEGHSRYPDWVEPSPELRFHFERSFSVVCYAIKWIDTGIDFMATTEELIGEASVPIDMGDETGLRIRAAIESRVGKLTYDDKI